MNTFIKKTMLLVIALTLPVGATIWAYEEANVDKQPPHPPKHMKPGHEPWMSKLSESEREALKQAHDKVLATHPELKEALEALKAEKDQIRDSGKKPTPQQRKAIHEKGRDIRKQIHQEMLKVDPSLKPIFVKLEELKKNWFKKHPKKDGPNGPQEVQDKEDHQEQ